MNKAIPTSDQQKPRPKEGIPMRSILRRLSRRHTTAVAYLALFAALGGSAYAAVTVTGKNIKDGTVTGRDVKNRSLGTNELSTKAVSSLTGQRGPAEPQGPKGDRGEQGPAGPTGPQGEAGRVDTSALQTKVAKPGDTLTGVVTTASAPGQSLGVIGDSWGAVLPEGVAEPTFDFVTSPNTQCPGVGQATAGRLCVYVISQINRNDGYEHVFGDVWNATNRRYGWAFELEWVPPTADGIGWLNASWAYQVP